jgi:hypothetical protein
MLWEDRIRNYAKETGFPKCLFVGPDGRVVGTWIMGNDYRVKSTYYGGYSAGYLRRINSESRERAGAVTRCLRLPKGRKIGKRPVWVV